MKTLKVVAKNFSLLGEVAPSADALQKAPLEEVFRQVVITLDNTHLYEFSDGYCVNLVQAYPELNMDDITDLLVYFHHRRYRELLNRSRAIVAKMGEGRLYEVIAQSWREMNTEKPNKANMTEKVIKTPTLGEMSIDGKRDIEVEDIAAKGAFNVLEMVISSTDDTEAVSDLLQLITLYFFVALSEEGLMTEAENEETKSEETLGGMFFAQNFDDGMILLRGLVGDEGGYVHALNVAIYAAFNSFNMFKLSGGDGPFLR